MYDQGEPALEIFTDEPVEVQDCRKLPIVLKEVVECTPI
jgi:hypothetical protein